MRFINKFKIPTLLGLALIICGIAAGVFLVVKDQPFFTKASVDLTAQNITLSNITDTEATVSWQTTTATKSFITFGQKGPSEQTVLDDRDMSTPSPRTLHYSTIKNLQPQTNYLFKITSGNVTSETKDFKTGASASFQNGFGPIIGSILKDGKPLEEAVVYLSISDATIQSGLVKNQGNFLIPISLMRTDDLSNTFQPQEESIGKLTVISNSGQSNVAFLIRRSGIQLPPINLGEDVDLTSQTKKPEEEISERDKFDLNGDKQVNAVDYSEILLNFGSNPKNSRADVNGDGIVDNSDLQEMSKQLGIR